MSKRKLEHPSLDIVESKGTELSGKSLGLIGFGRIAQGVGAIAQVMGMTVHAFDPYLPPKVAKSQNTRGRGEQAEKLRQQGRQQAMGMAQMNSELEALVAERDELAEELSTARSESPCASRNSPRLCSVSGCEGRSRSARAPRSRRSE